MKADIASLYADMLAGVVGALPALKGLPVFWLGLPPASGSNPAFGWHTFPELDKLASAAFAGTEVIVLNVRQLAAERKRIDPSISADGLHWCNPGKATVPHFLAERLLHLLAHP